MTNQKEKSLFSNSEVLIPIIEALDRAGKNRKVSPLAIVGEAVSSVNLDSPSKKQDALIVNALLLILMSS